MVTRVFSVDLSLRVRFSPQRYSWSINTTLHMLPINVSVYLNLINKISRWVILNFHINLPFDFLQIDVYVQTYNIIYNIYIYMYIDKMIRYSEDDKTCTLGSRYHLCIFYWTICGLWPDVFFIYQSRNKYYYILFFFFFNLNLINFYTNIHNYSFKER